MILGPSQNTIKRYILNKSICLFLPDANDPKLFDERRLYRQHDVISWDRLAREEMIQRELAGAESADQVGNNDKHEVGQHDDEGQSIPQLNPPPPPLQYSVLDVLQWLVCFAFRVNLFLKMKSRASMEVLLGVMQEIVIHLTLVSVKLPAKHPAVGWEVWHAYAPLKFICATRP